LEQPAKHITVHNRNIFNFIVIISNHFFYSCCKDTTSFPSHQEKKGPLYEPLGLLYQMLSNKTSLHLLNIDVLWIMTQNGKSDRTYPDLTGKAFEAVYLVSSTSE
jgi:hypothetical protein